MKGQSLGEQEQDTRRKQGTGSFLALVWLHSTGCEGGTLPKCLGDRKRPDPAAHLPPPKPEANLSSTGKWDQDPAGCGDWILCVPPCYFPLSKSPTADFILWQKSYQYLMDTCISPSTRQSEARGSSVQANSLNGALKMEDRKQMLTLDSEKAEEMPRANFSRQNRISPFLRKTSTCCLGLSDFCSTAAIMEVPYESPDPHSFHASLF